MAEHTTTRRYKATAPTPAKCGHCFGTGKEPDQKAFGAKMRTLRTKAKLQLAQVADRMKISGSYLSDLERGVRPWSLELKTKFEEALKPVPPTQTE